MVWKKVAPKSEYGKLEYLCVMFTWHLLDQTLFCKSIRIKKPEAESCNMFVGKSLEDWCEELGRYHLALLYFGRILTICRYIHTYNIYLQGDYIVRHKCCSQNLPCYFGGV